MKRRKVFTEEELAAALDEGADFIEVEGDLAKKTFRIRAAGTVAWALAIGCIAAAVAAAIVATKMNDTKVSVVSGLAAAGLSVAPAAAIGPAAVAAAIGIAVSAGGVSVLNRLREYDQHSFEDGVLVLLKN
ncbi:hypothetical protein ASF84_05160 [Pseudomonas sp. Leaf127]|uniref:hypothetical protein n=1 Tax=Pseudomonas sp. Leaf127 TaxID=1736267 RepID=UPI000702BF59|nr:hypothetical protein [Pseudomonas sp. Leaf127]KQQ60101.1 hypothetical protein ASF84_05160 [Pseudomonas sp. Leaf127]